MSSSEDDPFCFNTSVQPSNAEITYSQLNSAKRKKYTKSRSSLHGKPTKKAKIFTLTKTSQKVKVKFIKNKPSPHHKKEATSVKTQFCSYCQIPMRKFDHCKLSQHLDVCQHKEIYKRPDCVNMFICKETSEDHYWTFSHLKLAQCGSTNNNINEAGETSLPDLQSTSKYIDKVNDLETDDLDDEINAAINTSKSLNDSSSNTSLENSNIKERQSPLHSENSPDILTELQELENSIDKFSSITVNQSASNSPCDGGSNCNGRHVHIHIDKKEIKQVVQTSILDYFKLKNQNSSVRKCNNNSNNLRNNKNSFYTIDKQKNNNSEHAWNNIFLKQKKSTFVDVEFAANNQNCTKSTKKKCPFYKIIPNTGFAVDAFNYGDIEGISLYFLSHFHYDHYIGLSRNWNKSIYCSKITANLIKLKLNVSAKVINILPLNQSVIINGVEVTALEANHCPGAVMFLFKCKTGKTILHVGDFRAHPMHESIPELWNCDVDTLYLDTTYCDPKYKFPSQDHVLDSCVEVVKKHLDQHPKLLVIAGSYTIGKEKVFMSIASYLECKIWADATKRKVLHCLEDDRINNCLTTDKSDAQVHVLSMNKLNAKNLIDYLESMSNKYTHAVVFRPTGWAYSSTSDSLTPKTFNNVYYYEVPYSEHSSYSELKRFVCFIKPKKIIPTVNTWNPTVRDHMKKSFNEWLKSAS